MKSCFMSPAGASWHNLRMTFTPAFTLRPAELRDVSAIVDLIRELAEFEHLTHLLQVTPEKLRPHLFGERPAAECLVAETTAGADAHAPRSGSVVGFALFYTNFSTFLAQPGLYLEDLYVKPAMRGQGIGEALLTRLARLALERKYGRFEWSVLDWNENAIRFYQRMGASMMPDWRICRVTGDALQAFGTGGMAADNVSRLRA
jgi:ribosomal protein S18 acetylase RimI-like enzyme